jgi:hypothetical protein
MLSKEIFKQREVIYPLIVIIHEDLEVIIDSIRDFPRRLDDDIFVNIPFVNYVKSKNNNG